jgi:AcrR family transcriptional regulator
MESDWRQHRDTFRHGNVPEALLTAALTRLQTQDVATLNLRELARDVGIDHRAVYRHFANKLALIAAIAEHGWRQMGRTMLAEAAGEPAGERALIAHGVGMFVFDRAQPSLAQLMGGPEFNETRNFPGLHAAISDTLGILSRDFEDIGLDPHAARSRAQLYAAALHGVSTKVLMKKLRLPAGRAKAEMTELCRMLAKGMT